MRQRPCKRLPELITTFSILMADEHGIVRDLGSMLGPALSPCGVLLQYVASLHQQQVATAFAAKRKPARAVLSFKHRRRRA
jgi:hypothetical protein